MASARRKLRATQILVVVLVAYSGLYASRNLPVSSMLLTMIMAPVLSEVLASASENAEIASWIRVGLSRLRGFSARMQNLELHLQGHLWLILAFVLGLWACMHGGRLGTTQLINAYFDEKRFPVEAAEVIAQRHIDDPIFCPDQWGGYLIYRLYPQAKVLVDDRHDLYGDQFFKEYLRVVFVQPGWNKVLDERQVKWILVPRDSSLGTILEQTPSWKLIHQDETAMLFHR